MSEDWNRWSSIYLFPPSDASLMCQVIRKLQAYSGQVALIAPIWPAQSWYPPLKEWCPQPVPLPVSNFLFDKIGNLKTSLTFALWTFKKRSGYPCMYQT